MQAFKCCLLFAILFVSTSDGAGGERITQPAKCAKEATSVPGERFRKGHTYEYTYEVNTTSGWTGDIAATPDSRLLCSVVVSVPGKCKLILEVLDCELLDRIASQNFAINNNSQRLAKELKKHPVYLHYNEGQVADHQITVFDSEPQHVINIKRAIVSILQLKVNPQLETDDDTYLLHDIFGSCQTRLSTSPGSGYQVETYRNLAACNLSHVSNNPAGFLSFIKSSKQAHKYSPITELTYAFELNVACKYSVTPASRIEAALCVQKQIYNPWFTAAGTQGQATIEISQHIKLKSDAKLPARTVNHSLAGSVVVDLAMEFTAVKESFKSQDVMEKLEQTVVDFLGQGHQETASASFSTSSFRALVETMREAPERELRLAKETVYSCHNSSCDKQAHTPFDPKLLQSIKERLFYNGLMSCGTDSCLAVFAVSIQDGLIPDFEALIVVYNMGLYYQPSVSVVHIILEHCRKIDSQGCWLSLSAMIHHLTSDTQNEEEVSNIIFETISYIHRIIGDQCRQRPSEIEELLNKTLASGKLLTAIKAITNIGEAGMSFYNKNLYKGRSLVSALLQCVGNDHLSYVIARSAAQAIKSLGLEAEVVAQLLTVVEDEQRPLALRTAIFDILIEHNNEATLRSLLDILNTTKTSNLQTYITTRVAGLMKSQEPELHELRANFGEIMKDRAHSPLDDSTPLESRYAHYSHQFTVPIMTIQTGGYLAFNLIYTPASTVVQSFTLRTGWILDNRTFHLFDIVVDLEGMDAFLEMMNQKSSGHLNLTDPQNILNLLDIIQKYLQDKSKIEMPTFAHYSSRVNLALKKIFQLANMQRSLFPRVHLSVKVFGYEMGFISSDSLLLLMKKMKLNDGLQKEAYRAITEGIQTMLLRAFTLVDFQKVVPTVTGFPLETRVDSTVVAKTFVAAKTYMEEFIKNEKQKSSSFAVSSSLSAMLQASMKVSVGDYTSSGTTTRTSVAGMGDWNGLVKRLPPTESPDWLHRLSVIWDLDQKPFTFFHIRNDRSTVHNDKETHFNQSNQEKAFEKCLPDVYTRVFGHKTCVSGASYSSSGSSSSDVSSILVNPFRVEAILTPADNDLKYFSLDLKYQKRVSQYSGYTIAAQIEGPGLELSRQVTATANRNYDTGALDVKVDIPDGGLNYNLGHVSLSNNHEHHSKYASVLSRHGKAMNSFIFEKKGSHVPKVTSLPGNNTFMEIKKSAHFNISFGALSLDVFYKDRVPKRTDWVTDVTVSYHCEPKLKLLYIFHPDKNLAAANDHTSTFSYKQHTFDSKTSFAETWKGNNKMVITLPDQNFTMKTDMVADLKGAHRVTDVYWSQGNTTDFTHMNSSVHNRSTTALFKFDYFLHLDSKDKFEVEIEGHVQGQRANPLAMLNISTDINFSTPQSRSKPLFLSVLSKLKDVSSIYEASKSKLFSWWRGSEQKSDKNDAEAKKQMNELPTETQKSLLQQFLESLNWNVAIDTQIRMQPRMVAEPGGGKKKAGLEIHWLANATMPRGYNKLFLLNGSIFKGKEQTITLQLEDYFHDLKFKGKAEYSNTPEIFHHHHSWALIETSKHSYDRSFSFTVKLEHYKRFEYDLILHSPRADVEHHINYTKISPTDHTVRSFAIVQSVEPKFDLRYYESSNMTKKELLTDVQLFSTYLNHHFQLKKVAKSDGIVIEGKIHLTGKLPILRGEPTLSMLIALPRRHPPTSEWTYQYKDGPAKKVIVSLLGPNKITVGVKTAFNLQPNVTSTQDSVYSVMWTLELMESTYLQHTIELSPEMLDWIQNELQTFHRHAPGILIQYRDSILHNILADFKDKTLPSINKSAEELLKTRLQAAMRAGPGSKMAKMYKLALGGVHALNDILLDTPIVLLIKGGHIDDALAGSVKTLSNVLVDWTRQPPFLISQFAKAYIQPVLIEIKKSKLITFSTPLPFVMPGFNKLPQLTALERAVLVKVKDSILGKKTANKDIAAIFDGHTIRTFDGRYFQLAEPAAPSCTYLLGGDFKHGQFGLTYTKEGITVFSSRFGLTLAHDGSVFPITDPPIRSLPYASPDGQLSLSLQGGELQLSFAKGLIDVTFNPDSNVYLISFDRKLKNASIGILGTNNHESSDDFLLANGLTTSAGRHFQNSYELTKTKKCLVVSGRPSVSCEKLDFPSCKSLSEKLPNSEPCRLVINPKPFMESCLKAECSHQSGCSAARSYFAACRQQGFTVSVPAICDGHEHKSGLDIVVVQSLHHLVTRDKDPLTVCHILHASLAHLNLSIGLVTYGGVGEWKNPKLHLSNGKLMEKGKMAGRYMHLTVNTKDEDETEADAAVFAAAEYPFRSQSAKVILLVHQGKPKQPNKNSAVLLEVLKTKGISLVSASTYPDLGVGKSEGILLAKDVQELGGKTPSPQDLYSNIVISTSGLWLDLDMLSSLGKHKNRRLGKAFARMDT